MKAGAWDFIGKPFHRDQILLAVEKALAARTLREEVTGRVRVVRHRKGHVNRAILLRRPGDPEAFTLRDYQGRAYSFRQSLDDGRHCWKLRPLQGGRSEGNLAPESLRPIFTQVLRDCMVAA